MISNQPLPPELLAAFSDFVESRLGLRFAEKSRADVERGLRAAAAELGCVDVAECARRMMTPPDNAEDIEVLAAHLTVGETYFLREPQVFAALERMVLPELLGGRSARRLRIWSAGCCTGEEPYSLAITLARMKVNLDVWSGAILATDINPRFLQKASSGIYGQWSFRAIDHRIKEKYFDAIPGGRWQIIEPVKKLVAFSCLNLVDDVYPSLANDTNAMDIIFCRNVLMYFSRETTQKVISKLRNCLVDGGWLVTSATDASRDLFDGFTPVEYERTVLYRKNADQSLSSGHTETVQGSVSFAPHLKVAIPATPPPLAAPRSTLSAVTPSRSHKVPSGSDIDHRRLAHRLANEGRFAEALAEVDQQIGQDKLDAPSHYLRGVILMEQSRNDEAIVSLRRALYIDHDFIVAHFTLGNLLMRMGKAREAQRCFINARTLLGGCDRDLLVPESDGITAGRLLHIISAMEEAAA